MTNRKTWLMIALAGLVALALAAAAWLIFRPKAVEEGINLISNEGFEQVSGDLPEDWVIGRWFWDEGVSVLALSNDAYSGEHSVYVENVSENDARFEQTISVKPNSIYRISCMVRAEGCAIGRAGAGISVENTFISSDYAYDTQGEWVPLTLYGQTGADQTSLTIMCRIGGYGSENVGRAWFDDVQVVRLAAAPDDVIVKGLATTSPSGSAIADDEAATSSALPVFALAALFAALCALAVCWQYKHPMSKGKALAALGLALAVGVTLRIVLAVSVRGFDVDMNCFEGWAERMAVYGPWGFYDAGWCDYPPGYMLMLWPIGLMRQLFGIAYDSPAHWLLVKLIPMTADVLIALFLRRISREKLGEGGSALLAAGYLINPAVIFNAAVWGQVDGVLTLLLLWAVYAAAQKKWTKSMVIFAIAALCKPQALMFGPIGVMALACELLWHKDSRRENLIKIGKALGIAAAVFLLIALPCSLGQKRDPVTWLFERYTTSLSEYNYITVSACNFYQLLNMNWRALGDAGVWVYLSWAAYGAAFALAGWYMLRGRDHRHLFLICGVTLGIIFAFGAKMHERYLYPVIGLLLAAYVMERDWRVLACAVLFSMSAYINESLVLQDTYLTNSGTAAAVASFICIEAAQLTAFVGWDICVRGHSASLADAHAQVKRAAAPGEAQDWRLRLGKKDWAIMLAVTLGYAVVAFVNLGSTEAPQSAWTSSAAGESVVFELQDSTQFHVMYYGGICNSSFTLSFSDDGESWSPEELALYDQGQIFRWLWHTPYSRSDSGTFTAIGDVTATYTARYIRLTAEKVGLVLHEVGFVDDSGAALPIVSVTSYGGDALRAMDPALLTDEQPTVPACPSYYNSSYFDEIYHARTGYEFAHNMRPYETTHPPLGKVLIMLGIELFGMTPFGWRFMGALFGVMMLPVMYLLVKQLLKKTSYAALGMTLLALDAMHFTQTRIATIDTYGVFFILLMYLFMFRYCQMSFYVDDFKKTLLPLALSGVSMGLGIASKWICIYAAVGLAILFFCTMLRRYLEHRVTGQAFWKKFFTTCAWCVGVFILAPLVIYYFSYYWYMRPSGGLSIDRVWQAQLNMFNYHKGLSGDTHFFRSPWYEWPLIVKPMWYFSGTGYMPEGIISSISCMGNPAVWWVGLASLLFIRWRWWNGQGGRTAFYVVLGFAAQFLPWLLVPRSTFIYHYFASVPFIIICTVMTVDALKARWPRAARNGAIALVAAAAVLFAAFYPLESGMPVARSYANLLRWFNWYNF